MLISSDPTATTEPGGSDLQANILHLVAKEILRQDDLRGMTTRYQELISTLRALYDDKLRVAESARLDAIRLVDTGNVARATSEAEQRANTLAGQVASAADAVRATLEAARIQTADTLQAVVEPIKVDIADLRRVQYQQAGERVAQTETKGDSQWKTMAVIGAIALVLTVAGFFVSVAIAVGVFLATHK